DVEPGVVLGWSSLRLAKGIVDFGNGIITIFPGLDSFNNDSDDDWEAIIESLDVSDLTQLNVTGIPKNVCNMEKSSRNKKRPSGNYKMSYSNEGHSLTIKKPLTQEEVSREEIEKDIYERILLLQEPRPIIETLKFSDQHKKLLDSELLDKLNDDEEEYNLKSDKNGKPFYRLTRAKYLSCDDPIDHTLSLQEALNPFKKVCVWKKIIAFLRSQPIPLKNSEWTPNYSDNFSKNGDGDSKWHAKIRIVNPYENVFDHGCETRATERKMSKYYKLSDIMSPDWF
nr:hypothetical protein [Tanacetum cinerariifolium]